MPRSIWTGAISFGLVTVPIRLSSVVRRQGISFHQLHDHDGARIQHRRFCSAEDREVPREEIVRGYELEGGRYVTVTDEELERLDPDRTHTIDIERFVDLGGIDPVLYDSSYYAVPDGEIAAKPYELLRRAMAQSGRVAIGRVVIRTKEHLAALRPTGDLLTVSTMLFPDEVVPREDVELPEARGEATDGEVEVACRLVDSLAAEFEPETYRDSYRERILQLIECKARGEEVVVEPAAERAEPAPDLMAALEASIARARGGSGEDGLANGQGDRAGPASARA
ncbi:MAG: Ku protein [Actinomycetota bacterium]|nr:Ku protein [Actinomycetota bacterium]